MIMNNKVYDILKWVALVVLPALAVFYGRLAGIWGLPFADQIPETITAVEFLLGVLLGISNVTYKKNNLK